MNPLSIFTGPYALLAKWGIIAALAISVFGFGWLKGNEHGTRKLTEYQAKQAIEAVKLTAAREKIVTVTEVKYRNRIKVVYKRGETIEKEVVKYVTKTDDAGCTIPVGFVRNFNAAWENSPAGPPVESDRRSSDVPLSAVAEADTFNATICHAYKAQRDGLIEFYRGLQALDRK